MRQTFASALALLSVPLASAHYTFDQLVHNDVLVGRPWEYIRQHDRGYMPTFQAEAATSNDFRCNLNALSGENTDVFTVRVGDKLGIKKAFGEGGMEHPGPVQVYMSQAPDSVRSYDGSGDWFKVFQGLVCRNRGAEGFLNDNWCMWSENTISFEIPDVPEGEYLVRAEHIALHGAHDNNAEFYYACAQVKVEGSTAASVEGPTVKIPGVYSVGDAPHNFNIWNGRLTSYPLIPGPDVIAGGQIRGNANGSSDGIVVVEGVLSPQPEPQPEPSPEPSPEPEPVPTESVELPPTPTPSAEPSDVPVSPPDATSDSPSEPTPTQCPSRRRRRRRSGRKSVKRSSRK